MRPMGDITVDLITQPDEVSRWLPDLFRLWEAHLQGRRTPAGLPATVRTPGIHGGQSGWAGLVELWLMRLDGEAIAFSYGLRGREATTSYIMAYETRCPSSRRASYCSSVCWSEPRQSGIRSTTSRLARLPTGSVWATGVRPVYRMLWGRLARCHAAGEQLWVRARSVPWLHRLKSRDWRASGSRSPGHDCLMCPAWPRVDLRARWCMRLAVMRRHLHSARCGSPKCVPCSPPPAVARERGSVPGRHGVCTRAQRARGGCNFRVARPRWKEIAGEWADQFGGNEVFYRLVSAGGDSTTGLATSLPGPSLLLASATVPGARLLGVHGPPDPGFRSVARGWVAAHGRDDVCLPAWRPSWMFGGPSRRAYLAGWS